LRDAAPIAAKRLAPVYEALNWQWRDIGIPGEREILESIHDSINSFDRPDIIACSSGGIRVRIGMDEDNMYCEAGIEFTYYLQSNDIDDAEGSAKQIEREIAK